MKAIRSILLSGIIISYCSSGMIAGAEEKGSGSKPAKSLSSKPGKTKISMKEAIEKLRTAKVLASAETGEAAEPPDEYQAFLAVVPKVKEAEPELLKIVETGTPAGKIYAAVLLYYVDSKFGLKTLKKLESSKEELKFQSGCKVCHDTVGNVAHALGTEGRFLTFTLGAK